MDICTDQKVLHIQHGERVEDDVPYDQRPFEKGIMRVRWMSAVADECRSYYKERTSRYTQSVVPIVHPHQRWYHEKKATHCNLAVGVSLAL